MNANKLRRVVIAGGGTAGWMAAASLSKLLGKSLSVTLIESEEIGTVGVGEATIPPIRTLHKLLEIDERDFLRATNATFKLGIEFENWRSKGQRYIHSFGVTGRECWAGEFHHFWLRALREGLLHDFGEYCFELKAAQQSRFGILPNLPINFAYHLDATRYAAFLREMSERQGVARVEGRIASVRTNSKSGFIESICLDSGQEIHGDFFIDCTGFHGLLIEKALHTGYEDWSHCLPCDSAIAVQTETVAPALPYTRSIAHQAGWQWRIPLQHRVGNGIVYCSHYLNDDDARDLLLHDLKGKTINEPRLIKFRTGRRRKGWNKNCVALGLASGFIEPLESTSIHLIMTGVVRLMRLFPFDGIHDSAIDEYNTKFYNETENIRDFIIMHYVVTERSDGDFWHYCRNMDIPESLRHKLDLFRETARVFLDDGDVFRVDSWTQVMLGQGLMPTQYHRIADEMGKAELERFLTSLRSNVASAVEKLPHHQQFVDHFCQ